MDNTQHHSLVEIDPDRYPAYDRNSDIRLEHDPDNDAHPRFSDYEYSPDWIGERSSLGLIYDESDVRATAYSDRLVRRGRGDVRSNNRLSSIYGGNLVSWASNRLREDAAHFSIPEEFEDRDDAASVADIDQQRPVVESFPVEPDDEYHTLPISNVEPASQLDLAKCDSTLQASRDSSYRVQAEITDATVPPSAKTPSVDALFAAADETNAAESIMKTFRIGLSDPCYKVLPITLEKYNIPEKDWNLFAFSIDYNKNGVSHQLRLNPEESLLSVFKKLQEDGVSPQVMLRKFNDPAIRVLDLPAIDATSPVSPVSPLTSFEHTRLSMSDQSESEFAACYGSVPPPKVTDFATLQPVFTAVAISNFEPPSSKYVSNQYGWLSYQKGDVLDIFWRNSSVALGRRTKLPYKNWEPSTSQPGWIGPKHFSKDLTVYVKRKR